MLLLYYLVWNPFISSLYWLQIGRCNIETLWRACCTAVIFVHNRASAKPGWYVQWNYTPDIKLEVSSPHSTILFRSFIIYTVRMKSWTLNCNSSDKSHSKRKRRPRMLVLSKWNLNVFRTLDYQHVLTENLETIWHSQIPDQWWLLYHPICRVICNWGYSQSTWPSNY